MKRPLTDLDLCYNLPVTFSPSGVIPPTQEISLTTTLTQNTSLQFIPPAGKTYGLIDLTVNVPSQQQTPTQLVTTITTNTTITMDKVLFDSVEITTDIPQTWPHETYDSIAIKVGNGSWTQVPFSNFTANTNTTSSQSIGGTDLLAIVINQYYDADGFPGHYYIDTAYNMGVMLQKFGGTNARRGIAYYTTAFSAPSNLKSFSIRLYHSSIGIDSENRDIAYQTSSTNLSKQWLQTSVYQEELMDIPYPTIEN